MRKLILTLSAAGAALAIATPAAAQYYPQPQIQAYGYNGYNNGYGYNAYGAQNLAMRIDMVQRRISELKRAHILRGDRAERLRHEARDLERRIRRGNGYAFGRIGAGDLQMRVARLEQRVAEAASMRRYGGYGYNGNGYGNYGYANGYGQQGYGDRDRDHDRDDRYDHDDDD